jgi:hypothetical protein
VTSPGLWGWLELPKAKPKFPFPSAQKKCFVPIFPLFSTIAVIISSPPALGADGQEVIYFFTLSAIVSYILKLV